MSDLDARVAALMEIALEYRSTIYDAPGKRMALEQAIRAELQKPAQEEITDAEKMAQTRYHVDKTNGGFWPYVVRCGTGTQVLHKGHLKSCLNVAQMLTGAFLDGAFVAVRASKGEKT